MFPKNQNINVPCFKMHVICNYNVVPVCILCRVTPVDHSYKMYCIHLCHYTFVNKSQYLTTGLFDKALVISKFQNHVWFWYGTLENKKKKKKKKHVAKLAFCKLHNMNNCICIRTDTNFHEIATRGIVFYKDHLRYDLKDHLRYDLNDHLRYDLNNHLRYDLKCLEESDPSAWWVKG